MVHVRDAERFDEVGHANRSVFAHLLEDQRLPLACQAGRRTVEVRDSRLVRRAIGPIGTHVSLFSSLDDRHPGRSLSNPARTPTVKSTYSDKITRNVAVNPLTPGARWPDNRPGPVGSCENHGRLNRPHREEMAPLWKIFRDPAFLSGGQVKSA